MTERSASRSVTGVRPPGRASPLIWAAGSIVVRPSPSGAEYDAAEGALHPVVAVIPETGRQVLYVNPEYTTRFEGWTRRESLPLLRYLFEHGSKAEFVTRFRWRPGSIAFWDNRQVWHMAVNDYHGMRRVMNRIVLAGTKPLPAL